MSWASTPEGVPAPRQHTAPEPGRATSSWTGRRPKAAMSDPVAVHAPVAWLLLAMVLEVAGLTLGLSAQGRPVQATLGWALGGLGPIAALAAFTVHDTRRRTDPWYSSGPVPAASRMWLGSVALLVVALNSYHFADWVSRR